MPRSPWRVASTCTHGYPNTIVSPSRLADGTPFPTWAWLTCPWLAEKVSAEESAGGTSRWAEAAALDPQLAEQLQALDVAVREARASESVDEDACPTVGIAGQREPLGVKCLHAHVALALAGLDDPIGSETIARFGTACADRRCDRIVQAHEMEE